MSELEAVLTGALLVVFIWGVVEIRRERKELQKANETLDRIEKERP